MADRTLTIRYVTIHDDVDGAPFLRTKKKSPPISMELGHAIEKYTKAWVVKELRAIADELERRKS